MEDRELLDGLRRSDHAAFDAIFREHYAPLVAFLAGMLRDRAVAEELAQDVMLQLWRRRDSLVIQESLRAYLFRAGRNRGLNHLRHARVEREAQPHVARPDAVEPRGDSALVASELQAAIQQALSALPPRCREVFELSRSSGLRYAEIAATLGISIKTVETQMGKALQLLRERLGPWLAERTPR